MTYAAGGERLVVREREGIWRRRGRGYGGGEGRGRSIKRSPGAISWGNYLVGDLDADLGVAFFFDADFSFTGFWGDDFAVLFSVFLGLSVFAG